MNNTPKNFGFDTRSLHAGYQPDESTGARAVPIYQTTSFVFNNTDHAASLFALQEFGPIYTRIGNPTLSVLEERVSSLENGSAGVASSSGMASQFMTFLTLCSSGDEVVSSGRLYGGSYTQMDVTFKKLGIKVHFVNPDRIDHFAEKINDRTKAIYAETIGNPYTNVIDIRALADLANAHGIPLIIDNTMATPWLCRPLDHGAHIVLHSATKFLGGHGNSLGGVMVDGGQFNWGNGRFPEMENPSAYYHGLKFYENFRECAFAMKVRAEALRDVGACLSPMNAFLLLQGIETLSLRMDRHCENARKVALFLKEHPCVEWVHYPGISDSPYFELCQKYLKGKGGSVFTFGVKGGRSGGQKLIENVNLFSHLANIGDVRSLIIHPASTTHQQLSDADLIMTGVKPEMVRISVGIEDIEDILWDLDQALNASKE